MSLSTQQQRLVPTLEYLKPWDQLMPDSDF